MSYNNSINLNDCITDLQTLDDFNLDVSRLKLFLEEAKLLKRDQEELKNIINLMTIKNTKVKNQVGKTMNALNRISISY